jgi:hypothetical protein
VRDRVLIDHRTGGSAKTEYTRMPNQGMTTLISQLREAVAGLWHRLGSGSGFVQHGSGALATHGGTAARAGGVAVREDVQGGINMGVSERKA